ncbi:hypothetical protein OS493_016534 [Desmophyllum pertusum]|uniref:Hcy-binding domain-containing protein n=1 Tax=Desmophyllum pertusum TaxID=174260 RepID=A0A9W9ZQB9_9CNID|nr:hypothetical protein OS493_016534 [Desmophyllum pertusum]
MGIRYIGACCGFEPYHIRAIAEELAKERGKLPAASEKHGLWGDSLRQHTYPWVRARAKRSHWENLNPASGRPLSSAHAKMEGLGRDLHPDTKICRSIQSLQKRLEERSFNLGLPPV